MLWRITAPSSRTNLVVETPDARSLRCNRLADLGTHRIEGRQKQRREPQQLSDQRLLLCDLRLEGLAPARVFVQPLPARALGEAGLLRGALGRANTVARPNQRRVRFLASPRRGVAGSVGGVCSCDARPDEPCAEVGRLGRSCDRGVPARAEEQYGDGEHEGERPGTACLREQALRRARPRLPHGLGASCGDQRREREETDHVHIR